MDKVIKKLKTLKDIYIVILDKENLLDSRIIKYFISKGLQIYKISRFSEKRIEDILKQADIVLLSSFNNEKFNLKINELCVKNNVPFLTARMFLTFCEIGPLVIPYKTACFKCYQLRLESNNSKISANLKTPTKFFPFLTIFTSFIFLELINFLILKTSSSIGNILEIDFKNFSIKKHPVLKVPFCPVCGDKYGRQFIR